MDKPDERYYWPDGSVKWGYPVNVQHLIIQLETMDPEMKVSSVIHINGKARAYGLSMSLERWGENGWLDYSLSIPHCLAIWASTKPDTETSAPQTRGGGMMAVMRVRYTKLGGHYHCRVFTARQENQTFANCGELVFDETEWESVKELMAGAEFVADRQ